MKMRVRAALMHLSASVLIAFAAAGLVFGLWYPQPFYELLGGRQLFLWLVFIDVVIGPVLTFVIFNVNKPRQELMRDVGIVVFLQLCALFYGLHIVMQARPVWVAYEGDRFRLVRVVDVNIENIGDAPESLRSLSWTGPKLLAVRLAQPTDFDYLQSVQASIQGDHPAFRPNRWLPYSEKTSQVLNAALLVDQLKSAKPEQATRLEEFLAAAKRKEDDVVYLPMIAGDHNDWVVVLDRKSAELIGFAHIDGWLE